MVDQRIALVLRYHEMKADPLYNFLEIAHFMGMDLTTEEVKVVMDKTSVSAMHKLESQGGLPHVNRLVTAESLPCGHGLTLPRSPHCCSCNNPFAQGREGGCQGAIRDDR